MKKFNLDDCNTLGRIAAELAFAENRSIPPAGNLVMMTGLESLPAGTELTPYLKAYNSAYDKALESASHSALVASGFYDA